MNLNYLFDDYASRMTDAPPVLDDVTKIEPKGEQYLPVVLDYVRWSMEWRLTHCAVAHKEEIKAFEVGDLWL
jgi:hypothetical protein